VVKNFKFSHVFVFVLHTLDIAGTSYQLHVGIARIFHKPLRLVLDRSVCAAFSLMTAGVG
jgi:hypothetical protein